MTVTNRQEGCLSQRCRVVDAPTFGGALILQAIPKHASRFTDYSAKFSHPSRERCAGISLNRSWPTNLRFASAIHRSSNPHSACGSCAPLVHAKNKPAGGLSPPRRERVHSRAAPFSVSNARDVNRVSCLGSRTSHCSCASYSEPAVARSSSTPSQIKARVAVKTNAEFVSNPVRRRRAPHATSLRTAGANGSVLIQHFGESLSQSPLLVRAYHHHH